MDLLAQLNALLGAFVGAGLAGGVMLFLARALVQRAFDRDLEDFKSRLALETAMQVERLRTELELNRAHAEARFQAHLHAALLSLSNLEGMLSRAERSVWHGLMDASTVGAARDEVRRLDAAAAESTTLQSETSVALHSATAMMMTTLEILPSDTRNEVVEGLCRSLDLARRALASDRSKLLPRREVDA